MSTLYRPVPISEVYDPDGHVNDCPWCAGVMLANGASGGAHPHTLAEAEAIEIAAGGPYPLGGGPSEVYDGLHRRYGITPGLATSAGGIMAQAKVGASLLVSGKYGQLPSHYRRFSPYFTGGHEIYVGVETATTGWIIDPLFHDEPGYAGEGITLANVAAFAQGGYGGLFMPTHVIPAAPTDPSAYVHVVRVKAAATLGLNMHATPHQAGVFVAHLAPGTTVKTIERLAHGESYVVGSTTYTSWLYVSYAVSGTTKKGWIKEGWTTKVS